MPVTTVVPSHGAIVTGTEGSQLLKDNFPKIKKGAQDLIRQPSF